MWSVGVTGLIIPDAGGVVTERAGVFTTSLVWFPLSLGTAVSVLLELPDDTKGFTI